MRDMRIHPCKGRVLMYYYALYYYARTRKHVWACTGMRNFASGLELPVYAQLQALGCVSSLLTRSHYLHYSIGFYFW